MIFCKPADRCTLLTIYSVTNTAILIFVNLNTPRYIKHELPDMIKTHSDQMNHIPDNPLKTYIQLNCAVNMGGEILTTL